MSRKTATEILIFFYLRERWGLRFSVSMTPSINSWFLCSLPTLLWKENLVSLPPHRCLLLFPNYLESEATCRVHPFMTSLTVEKIVWITTFPSVAPWLYFLFKNIEKHTKMKRKETFGNVSSIHIGNWETQINQQTVKWLAIWFLPLDKDCIIRKEHYSIYYAMYWLQWSLNFVNASSNSTLSENLYFAVNREGYVCKRRKKENFTLSRKCFTMFVYSHINLNHGLQIHNFR